MGVGSQGSPRVTAKVAIPIVLLCGGVGALLGTMFPPDVLMSRAYQAVHQHEPDKSPLGPPQNRPVGTKPASAPPSAVTTEPPTGGVRELPATGEQSASAREPVSVMTPAAVPDHAVTPVDQRAAAEGAEASLPVTGPTTEKLERRSAVRRKASQQRAALARRKQYAAPSKPAPAEGINSQTPSIDARVSEQWWR